MAKTDSKACIESEEEVTLYLSTEEAGALYALLDRVTDKGVEVPVLERVFEVLDAAGFNPLREYVDRDELNEIGAL